MSILAATLVTTLRHSHWRVKIYQWWNAPENFDSQIRVNKCVQDLAQTSCTCWTHLLLQSLPTRKQAENQQCITQFTHHLLSWQGYKNFPFFPKTIWMITPLAVRSLIPPKYPRTCLLLFASCFWGSFSQGPCKSDNDGARGTLFTDATKEIAGGLDFGRIPLKVSPRKKTTWTCSMS